MGAPAWAAIVGGGRALRYNISVWRIRVVWGEIWHREITALFSVSARASRGAAATQRLCQHSWGSTPAEGSHLSPLLPKLREHLIREAHRNLSHHYPPPSRNLFLNVFFFFNWDINHRMPQHNSCLLCCSFRSSLKSAPQSTLMQFDHACVTRFVIVATLFINYKGYSIVPLDVTTYRLYFSVVLLCWFVNANIAQACVVICKITRTSSG